MNVRFGAAALLVSATLVSAAPAGAKNLSVFRVCGAKGCVSSTNRAILRSLFGGIQAQRDAARVSTPAPAPFLRFEYWVTGDHEPSFVQYYVPSRRVVEVSTGPGSWTWVRPDAAQAEFTRVSRGVTPFPAPQFSSVTIGGKAVRDPGSYLQLFRLEGTPNRLPDRPDWERIAVRSGVPSPWSTTAATLEYSKSTNVLWRGNDFVRVPSNLAARIEEHRSLRSVARRHR